MLIRMTRALACLLVVVAVPARAELAISLEIEGTIGEIMQVLRVLKDAGLDGGGNPEEGGLKVEVHSAASPEAAETTPETAAVPVTTEDATGASFSDLTVRPELIEAGDILHVRVRLADAEGLVDTVEATLSNGEQDFAFDLFDNGSHGDSEPDDGVWSVDAMMPAHVAVGDFTLTLAAYDMLGAPVGDEAAPLTASTTVSVQP